MASTDSTSDPQFPRATKQRGKLLAHISAQNQFISAQELHALMRAAGESVGLSTVYRTLAALAEQGVVDVVQTEAGQALYRVCSREHHHHLLCKICGETTEIQANVIEQLARELAKVHGFTEVEHRLELLGICHKCNPKA